MAIRMLNASASFSTSAGSWKKIEAAQFGPAVTGVSQYTDCFTKQTGGALSVTNGVSLQGGYVCLNRKTSPSGTFTVALEENITGTWTQQAISASANVSTLGNEWGWYYVTFGTPYTATTNQFRLAVKSSASGDLYWMKSSGGGAFMGGIVGNGDDASAPSSGDTYVIKQGLTLTIDQSVTAGPTNGNSIILGQGTTLSVPAPAAAITIALGAGNILQGNDTTIAIGSSGSRVSAANKVTITNSLSNGAYTLATPMQAFMGSVPTLARTVLTMYGNISTALRLIISADCAAGQNIVTTTTAIPGSWTVGDTVRVVGKDTTTYNTTGYTISAIGTNQITLSANLDVKALAGGALVNLTEGSRNLGIQFVSTNQVYLCASVNNSANAKINFSQTDYSIIDGVYLSNTFLTVVGDDAGVSTNYTQIKNILCSINPGNTAYPTILVASNKGNVTISNVHVISDYANVSTASRLAWGANMTVSNVTISQYGAWNNHIEGNSPTVSDLILYSTDGTLNNGFNANFRALVSAGTFTDITCIGGQVQFNSCTATTLTRYKQSRSNTAGTIFNNSFITANNCTFGIGSTNTTADIYFPTTTISQVLANNCNLGSQGVNNNGNTIVGTYIEFHNYNGTVNDHRTWKTRGTFTTPNPYTSLVQQVNQSTNYLSHQYQLLSQSIAGKQHYLVATGQVAAAYYAGTHSVPKIDIYTDGNTTTPNATLSLADSNSTAQTLSQAFTPSTSNNQVILDFQTKTDATGTNANCTWSNVKIVQRIYGQTFTSTDLGITETLTYPIATLTTPVSNPFITVSNQATVHAYTMFSWNSGTSTLTVSADATVAQLYDWSQDYAATHPTEAVWFSTIDGVTFTLTGNMTINTGVTLTGTSSQRISMASYTLTLTGTGTTSGVIVTDVSGTHAPIALTGLVAGSTVYIRNTTDSVTILKAVVAGTSTTQFVTLSSDKALTVVVRNVNYLSYQTTGTVGVNGYSLVVSQIASDIYTSTTIDGSTVTEFSFTGSQVKVFLNTVSTTTVQRLIAWYIYTIATTSYIDLQASDMTFPDATWAKLLNTTGTQLKIKNISGSPIVITGGNITDANNDATTIVDNMGSNIFIVSSRPAASPGDMASAVWSNSKALTQSRFLALK